MLQTVSITSKRQVTIPASIYNKLNLKRGQRLIVSAQKNKIIMEPAQLLIENLAGSITLPRKFKGKSIQQIIQEAKKDYFSK